MAHRRSTAHRPKTGTRIPRSETARPMPPRPATTDVIWIAPFHNVSGYADEARALVTELATSGMSVAAKNLDPVTPGLASQLERDTPRIATAVNRALRHPARNAKMAVLHVTGDAAQRVAGPGPTVVRTMYETDSLPAQWVRQLNTVDEIWVPTAFNEQTFRAAGVTTDLHVVPGGVDSSWFRPGLSPLDLPTRAATTFLSVFEWSHRKAPDVLLRAWAEAFAPTDDVALLLRCFPRSHFGDVDATAVIDRLVDAELGAIGRRREEVAPIVVIGRHLSPDELRRLMCTCDVYVSPTRGEGWGRPLVEAQACAKVVITTNWSAPVHVLDPAAALLIDIDGLAQVEAQMDVAHYQGQHWASPNAGHLAELLRWAATHPDERDAMGARGREDMVRRWSWSAAAKVAQRRITVLTRPSWSRTGAVPAASSSLSGTDSRSLRLRSPKNPGSGATIVSPDPLETASREDPEDRPLVRFAGDVAAHHSLARVNRELCGALVRLPAPFGIEAVSSEAAVASGGGPSDFPTRVAGKGPCALEVRHRWPPDLSSPRGSKLVLVQPWEFGVIPQAWVQPILDHVSEVWTPSAASRQCFIAGGVPAEHVVVVPNGVDLAVFHPEGPRFGFAIPAQRRFLYVGGTIARKGFDIALTSYLETFTRADDVSFVVKPFLSDAEYRHMNGDGLLKAAATDPRAPQIEIVDRDLEDDELAALYRSCDVLLAPYRGEGFGLHILEAMACGTPAVVTAGGGADDFCDNVTSWMIPSSACSLAMDGFEAATGSFTVLEPDRRVLAAAMRVALADDGRRATKAEAGIARSTGWTWGHSASVAQERITALTTDVRRAHHGDAPARATTEPSGPESATSQGSARSTTSVLEKTIPDHIEQMLLSQQATIDLLKARIGEMERQIAPAAEMVRRWSAVPFCAAAGGLRTHDTAGRTVMGYRRTPGDPDVITAATANAAYLNFEDVFRGSSSRVRDLVRPYAQLLQGRRRVVELGCGRGELLGLLAAAGVEAVGVDTDAGMLSRARAQGLDVTNADLLEYLSNQPDCSADGIVTVEVMEHLDPTTVADLLAQAHRVLEPGGVLLAETVNPHNLTAHKLFWLDPTHRHPLFPETLLVLAASAGFDQATIWFPDSSGDVSADLANCDRYTLVATIDPVGLVR